MKQKELDQQMNLWAFGPAITVLAIFIGSGVFFQKELGAFLNSLLYGMADYFGWYINLLSLSCIFIVLAFVIYKYGDVKIGGEDAKPDFKTFNWLAMTISGSIGTGILFWAMGEPIFHYAMPPTGAGVEPFSRKAAIFAVSQAMWNWSFIQYSVYAMCAVAFALVTYNRKQCLSFGSLIECVFRRPIPWLTTAVHGLVICCLCGAVANSMGVGLLQVGAGIEKLFGIPQSKMIWLIIAVGIGVVFTISCVAGIGNGLKRLSTIKICIFSSVLVFVVVFGDTIFMSKLSTEAVGNMIDTWGTKTTTLNAMVPEDKWSADWIIQYWASFFVYAPVIGMFLSRLAKGRTVRQFVLVSVVVPSIFCMMWIGIFGSMTLSLQTKGVLNIWEAVNTYGMQTAIFQILSTMPLGSLLIAAFIVSTCISFCCLADPMAAVLSTLSVRRLQIDDEAPKKIKILMGIIITTVSYLLVASGGVNSIKGVFVLIGLPISFLMILCFFAAFKLCSECLTMENHGVVDDSDADCDCAPPTATVCTPECYQATRD
ncbi:BCCT family transporter [Acetonema longum]|uniref:BCCT transporter n=1 Tax=Acetonema longum DSM 6540 TaxID=1009370 RepID=F7NF23_9FIRM|nr:BCCT family transporter [Acetonema longum]EGO65584.1 BCCT transporter [Acetonema longum DSM 6540]